MAPYTLSSNCQTRLTNWFDQTWFRHTLSNLFEQAAQFSYGRLLLTMTSVLSAPLSDKELDVVAQSASCNESGTVCVPLSNYAYT